MINCPFCHWNRLADTSKGGVPFDQDMAILQLLEHLGKEHFEVWTNLLITWNTALEFSRA